MVSCATCKVPFKGQRLIGEKVKKGDGPGGKEHLAKDIGVSRPSAAQKVSKTINKRYNWGTDFGRSVP